MSEQENTLQYETARHAMVVSQLRPNRVTDEAVVEALDSIPREIFVPAALRGVAYMDEDIPLGNGRYLMEPLTFARLLQEAQISAADTVLDIGCATGYSSAVLGRLAGSVIGLEEDKELAEKATANLARIGCDNVAIVEGRLEAGLPRQAPFDVILLEGEVEEVPRALLDQLADGGRLLAVIEQAGKLGEAVLYLNTAGVISHRALFEAAIQPLPGFRRKREFLF